MKRCLIVDDSSVIRKVAREILERLEFEIAEAEGGEQALQLCRDRMPDVVLLDWNVPRMDGYAFLRLLRVGKIAPGPCPTAGSSQAILPTLRQAGIFASCSEGSRKT